MAQENVHDKSYHVYIGDTIQHGTITNTYKEEVKVAELTHSENLLTQNVLTEAQREAGYYLKEDDHCIYIYKADKILAVCSLYVTSDKIREEVDRLRKEVPK